MARQLYERWLIEGAGATLGEFVAEERARLRQARLQRRLAAQYGPLMQQMGQPVPTSLSMIQQQQVAMLTGGYRGSALGSIGGALHILFG